MTTPFSTTRYDAASAIGSNTETCARFPAVEQADGTHHAVNQLEKAVMCQFGALEAIRSGTTALHEDGVNIECYAPQMLETGLRMVLAERAWDGVGAGIRDPDPTEGRGNAAGRMLHPAFVA